MVTSEKTLLSPTREWPISEVVTYRKYSCNDVAQKEAKYHQDHTNGQQQHGSRVELPLFPVDGVIPAERRILGITFFIDLSDRLDLCP